MKNPFNHFELFGEIADEPTRKQLAEYISGCLQNKHNDTIPLSNDVIDNFATSIEIILSNKTTKELCKKNSDLAERVTTDILEFINNAKRHIQRSENRFETEQKLLDDFGQTTLNSFEKSWEKAAPFVQNEYKTQFPDKDIEYYHGKFQESLADEKKDKKRFSFENLKIIFLEKWGSLFFQKKLQWELNIIEEQRKEFCKKLYEQIEQLKKLQELLSPFTNELGRLWDMSKGRWQKVNFDILKKYADLLQHDKALKELAEMLGRMRQAEKEFEEELFTDIKFTTAWKIENAAKSDIIGVHESDDISNALPSEFALLADTATETIFYKKLVEKKLQTFEYQGRTKEIKEEFEKKRQKQKEDKKGPFIICADTSGSMHGTPETIVKTLCFALLKMAVRENRKCYLISFSDSKSIETLKLTDLKNNLEKLIEFLSMSFYGGTDANPAMLESLRMLETEDYKKADVIMVSDFVMPAFDEKTQEQITKAKEKKTKFHSLIIGASQNNNVIKEFDNNWLYDPNNQDSVLTLVKNLYEL